MTQLTKLPEVKEAGKFLSSLMGLEISTNECAKLDEKSLAVFAEFHNDDSPSRHFIACDLAASAMLGAALTGFPPGVAKEANDSGSLPENLLENLKEVLNIAVNLFPQSRSHRISLEKVLTESESCSEFVNCKDIPQVAIGIELPKYGAGTIVVGSE